MSKVRQILKLYSQKMGKKKIGERLGMSKNTVRHYIEAFHGMKTTIEELSKLWDAELNKRYHPPQEAIVSDKLAEPHAFFPEMQKQLRVGFGGVSLPRRSGVCLCGISNVF